MIFRYFPYKFLHPLVIIESPQQETSLYRRRLEPTEPQAADSGTSSCRPCSTITLSIGPSQARRSMAAKVPAALPNCRVGPGRCTQNQSPLTIWKQPVPHWSDRPLPAQPGLSLQVPADYLNSCPAVINKDCGWSPSKASMPQLLNRHMIQESPHGALSPKMENRDSLTDQSRPCLKTLDTV